jgi:hypothetical protein
MFGTEKIRLLFDERGPRWRHIFSLQPRQKSGHVKSPTNCVINLRRPNHDFIRLHERVKYTEKTGISQQKTGR